jgi:putative ABC transport system ATP-binding protein
VAALDNRKRTRLRRDCIGFVFQRFHLIRGLTALDNVCVPLTLRGSSSRVAARKAKGWLDAVGLADKAKTHPHNLSAGECQRVALARALAGDPEIILADEPTASLDATNGMEVISLLRRLAKQEGKTGVVVTHDSRIFSLADQIYSMENGAAVCAQRSGTEATSIDLLNPGVGP